MTRELSNSDLLDECLDLRMKAEELDNSESTINLLDIYVAKEKESGNMNGALAIREVQLMILGNARLLSLFSSHVKKYHDKELFCD